MFYDLPGDLVVEPDWLLGHAKAPAGAPTGALMPCALARVQRPARAGIAALVVSTLRRAGQAAQLGARAVTGIQPAGGTQARQGIGVEHRARALDVWTERAADIRPFIPVKAQPAQIRQHVRGRTRAHTGQV